VAFSAFATLTPARAPVLALLAFPNAVHAGGVSLCEYPQRTTKRCRDWSSQLERLMGLTFLGGKDLLRNLFNGFYHGRSFNISVDRRSQCFQFFHCIKPVLIQNLGISRDDLGGRVPKHLRNC